MPDLDDELMERYRAGDEDAFTLLVRRHQQPLINFIARYINDRDSAEDLAQETFVRIFKASPRYKPGQAHFKTWMYHIAANLCKNELRNRGRRNRYRVDNVVDGNGDSERIDLIESAPADAAFQPEVALERKELHDAIQSAIAELPEQYRVPLVLRDLQGLSYDEISETLELRSGTTKSRINRARLMLKDKLKSYV
ncbi:sigma-70 family RNA polymerase sigma factor [Candidatus Poribacteria bacterium]|nr:sigma-70 family RNA polymerase sigma factor [Candidatus Poribacteria bacterium]MYK17229.1 sigma-70 family RNA polymerase sigma factor [Candidatus Poribacteria bacterium]